MANRSLQNTLPSLSQTLGTETPQMLHGYRFRPDHLELIRFYLYPKITNHNHFTTANIPVRDCHLFGDLAREPWQIWDSFPKIQGEDLFFFTHLTKKGTNFVRKVNRGPGTWHQANKHLPFNVSIDNNCKVTAIKRLFTYRNPKSEQGGSWFLFEYSLPSLSEQIVLCHLRKKDQTIETQTTTKKRKRDDEGVDDATNTVLQKPRVDEHNEQQHIIRVNRAAESTVSEVENQRQHLELEPVFDCNGVQFDNFESFSHEFENDQMAANSKALASNVAPPIASTLNPVVNMQPNEVVCADNLYDGNASVIGDDDFYIKLIDFMGCYDEADEVPATQATPKAYGIQATPIGSTLDESFNADDVDYCLNPEVCNASLTDWINSG